MHPYQQMLYNDGWIRIKKEGKVAMLKTGIIIRVLLYMTLLCLKVISNNGYLKGIRK